MEATYEEQIKIIRNYIDQHDDGALFHINCDLLVIDVDRENAVDAKLLWASERRGSGVTRYFAVNYRYSLLHHVIKMISKDVINADVEGDLYKHVSVIKRSIYDDFEFRDKYPSDVSKKRICSTGLVTICIDLTSDTKFERGFLYSLCNQAMELAETVGVKVIIFKRPELKLQNLSTNGNYSWLCLGVKDEITSDLLSTAVKKDLIKYLDYDNLLCYDGLRYTRSDIKKFINDIGMDFYDIYEKRFRSLINRV